MPRSALERMALEATEQGKLIEAGWIGLRIAAFPADTPAEQLEQARQMFFAGAHHLFASIVNHLLDPGEDPTPAELARMDLINAELKAFIEVYAANHLPTKGSA